MENHDPFDKDMRTGNRIKYLDFTTPLNELSHRIKEIEQERVALKALSDYLIDEKISPQEFLDFFEYMRDAILSLKTSVAMLLEGNFGDLSEIQKERLNLIKDGISILSEKVSNTFDHKE